MLELKEFTKNLVEAKAKAEQELVAVKEKIIEQQSIVSHIPLVNLFFGQSDEKEQNKKLEGRTFNFRTKSVNSTSKIYDSMRQDEKSGRSTPMQKVLEKEEESESVIESEEVEKDSKSEKTEEEEAEKEVKEEVVEVEKKVKRVTIEEIEKPVKKKSTGAKKMKKVKAKPKK